MSEIPYLRETERMLQPDSNPPTADTFAPFEAS
jgi:hypothetical protein